MIYYEQDYYAIPETGAEKAFELLRQSMLLEKKVAIAKTVMGTNEKLLVLYPLKDGMIVKTLFYHDEIAAIPKQIPKMKLSEQEMEMARLRDAIMKKIRGQEIVTADTGAPDNVIDLMEALQKSLEQTKAEPADRRKAGSGGSVVLRNKRNMELLPRFPELCKISGQVRQKCVLYGELIVMVKGVPDFYELQKRTLLTNRAKIKLGAERLPASFVAYDCLQCGQRELLTVPLLERKQILAENVTEGERLAVSRYIQGKGTALFQMTVEKELEGVVAKQASSLYYPGKRTKDWIKFKRMADKDFVICGYETGNMVSLILGEYREGQLIYAGTVTMGVRREILQLLERGSCPFPKEIKTDREKSVVQAQTDVHSRIHAKYTGCSQVAGI